MVIPTSWKYAIFPSYPNGYSVKDWDSIPMIDASQPYGIAGIILIHHLTDDRNEAIVKYQERKTTPQLPHTPTTI